MSAPTVPRLMFPVLAVSTAAFSLLQSLVTPILPLLQVRLHTDQNTVTWVLTSYLLSASIATPILGRMGDVKGKKRVIVVVLLVTAAGSVLAALATSITVMIVARAIQGVGGAVMPLSFGMLRDELPPHRVGGAVGTVAALGAIGAGVGLVLAGPVVDALSYHWLFWIPGGVVASAAIVAHRVIPDHRGPAEGQISWTPALLLSGWLVALLLAVSKGPAWGWGSVRVLALLSCAAVLSAGWIRAESRAATPLIDLQMMRIPTVLRTNVVALLFGAVLFSVFAFVPKLLQTPSSAGYGFGASITESGLIVLPMTVMMFVTGLLSGRISRRWGAKAVLLAGTITCVAPFILLAAAHAALWQLVVATTVIGTGVGLVFAAMPAIIVEAVRADQTGVAAGMNANIRTIGGAVGAGVLSSLLTSDLQRSGLPFDSGYRTCFLILAIASAAAGLAAAWIPRAPVLAIDSRPELKPA